MEIRDLLIKFKRTVFRNDVLKEALIKILKIEIGHAIDPRDVELKEGKFLVKAPHVIKNEIFLKREKIREALLKETGENLEVC